MSIFRRQPSHRRKQSGEEATPVGSLRTWGELLAEICLMTQVETVLHFYLVTIKTKSRAATIYTSLIEFKKAPTIVVKTSLDTLILLLSSA